GGDQGRERGKARRADTADDLAGAGNVDRIGDGAEEDQHTAFDDGMDVAGRVHGLDRGDRDADIGQDQRDDAGAPDRLFEQEDRDDRDDGRIEEQDQPLEARGDVGEAEKIQQAGEVVADGTEE